MRRIAAALLAAALLCPVIGGRQGEAGKSPHFPGLSDSGFDAYAKSTLELEKALLDRMVRDEKNFHEVLQDQQSTINKQLDMNEELKGMIAGNSLEINDLEARVAALEAARKETGANGPKDTR